MGCTTDYSNVNIRLVHKNDTTLHCVMCLSASHSLHIHFITQDRSFADVDLAQRITLVRITQPLHSEAQNVNKAKEIGILDGKIKKERKHFADVEEKVLKGLSE